MMRHCEEAPPEELLRAIDEFNRSAWFDCHETLEELWVGEEGEMRDFYQGVLQVTVALHHWREGNFGGAVRLLENGANYLRRVRPLCQGVDTAGLVISADRLRAVLQRLGPARMAELDRELIPKLLLAPFPAGEGSRD